MAFAPAAGCGAAVKGPKLRWGYMNSMYQRLAFQTRITVAFVLLMATVMVIVILAEQVDYDELRARVISQSLRQEALALEEDLKKGIPPKLPEWSQLHDAGTVPESLRQYAPGYHRVADSEGLYLLVFERSGQRYYLLHDGKGYRYLEYLIDGFGPAIIMLCMLFAFGFGRWTSARVTAPITRLAEAVQRKQKPLPFLEDIDEIGMLARAFAKHSDELEQFLQRERCFVGDASHELRTPLAIIAGAAEVIMHQLPADSHLVPSADRIVRTIQDMHSQLKCLLLLSRDPQALVYTNVAMRPLIEECVASCKPWLLRKDVELTLDMPQDVSAHTHPELARSVVLNLVRNACQYTDIGEVRVSLEGRRLVISDSGPGLPASLDPTDFQRFTPSMHQAGEGLGLSIVQRIVTHLGWSMEVDSSEKGCHFALEICGIVYDGSICAH